MRLLRVTDLTFENVPSHGPFPEYAILSHMWITPGSEEVTFQDLQDPDRQRASSKAGWQKVLYTVEQAKRHLLDYVWIDTCCINKLDPTELTEAINCMFFWYQSAQNCYAYLSDHSRAQHGTNVTRSRWFTRGWTLQELIAPPQLDFFDSDWLFLTSRPVTAKTIAAVTGIAQDLLENGPNDRMQTSQVSVDSFLWESPIQSSRLSRYSIAQRMSWAARRETTRVEDRAYSLLGLFGIIMPLHYGEGEENAFKRLQQEIIKFSADQSVFAWRRPERSSGHQMQSQTPFLAPSPDCFRSRGHIVPRHSTRRAAFSISNVGLEIEATIFQRSKIDEGKLLTGAPISNNHRIESSRPGDATMARLPHTLTSRDQPQYEAEKASFWDQFGLILDCQSLNDPSAAFSLPLRKETGDRYILSGIGECEDHDGTALQSELEYFRKSLDRRKITILRSSSAETDMAADRHQGPYLKLRINSGPGYPLAGTTALFIEEVYPTDSWSTETFCHNPLFSHSDVYTAAIRLRCVGSPAMFIAVSYGERGVFALEIGEAGQDLAEICDEIERDRVPRQMATKSGLFKQTELHVAMQKVRDLWAEHWEMRIVTRRLYLED